MSDVTTSATIASLRAEVERLTAELQGERDDLAAMHTILRQSQSLCGDWQMAVMLAVPHGTVWDASNPKAMVQAIISDRNAYAERLLAENVRLSNEAATERSRAGVLEAEVRAYREWQRTKCDDNASSLDHWHACKALDAATLETDRTHALDAAKFDQHKRGSIIECLDNVREAGGKAWDNVANPDAVLRGDDDKEHK